MNSDYSTRASKILINLANLDNNICQIKKKIGNTKLMAVVKANAYGHGLLPVAKRLEGLGIDYLGVALLEEGIQLRQGGISLPIHVFGGIVGEQIEDFVKYDLELSASSLSKIIQIDQTATKFGKQAKVHLKIDTGMGRIGVRPESAYQLIQTCLSLTNTKVVGIFSHYACSDEQDLSFTEKQFQDFMPLVIYAKQQLGSDLIAHISNSAAIINYQKSNIDLVRAGLIIYGVYPNNSFQNSLDLKPVLSVKSKVVYFKQVPKGFSVSYGRSWTAPDESRIVTIPIGYGDGYLRALSNKAQVLINAKRYPIVGKICMDQLMINICADSAYNNDTVTLIGAEGKEGISVEELAELAGTVPHEILSNLNLRLAREYVS